MRPLGDPQDVTASQERQNPQHVHDTLCIIRKGSLSLKGSSKGFYKGYQTKAKTLQNRGELVAQPYFKKKKLSPIAP